MSLVSSKKLASCLVKFYFYSFLGSTQATNGMSNPSSTGMVFHLIPLEKCYFTEVIKIFDIYFHINI